MNGALSFVSGQPCQVLVVAAAAAQFYYVDNIDVASLPLAEIREFVVVNTLVRHTDLFIHCTDITFSDIE